MIDGPTVYVHIGEPKCGTTYLQEIVWNNRRTLARYGVVLPGLYAQDQFRASEDLRDAPHAPDDPGGSCRGEWDVLAAQARSSRVALISQEHLCGATAAQAERAVRSLAPAEVHVVLTLRGFSSLLPAEWQETVKHRNRWTLDRWLTDIADPRSRAGDNPRWFWRAHDTLAVLNRWSRSLPANRVHVITVPPTRAEPTLLWERFASVIGVPAGSIDTTRARSNVSLGIAEVEMLRRLNRKLPRDVPAWFYAREVKERLAHDVLAARARPTRLGLPADMHGWASEHTEQTIAGLQTAGYHVVGDLAELRSPPTTGTYAAPADATDAAMLDAALESLAALVRDRYHDVDRGSPSTRAKRLARDVTARYAAAARLRMLAWRVMQGRDSGRASR